MSAYVTLYTWYAVLPGLGGAAAGLLTGRWRWAAAAGALMLALFSFMAGRVPQNVAFLPITAGGGQGASALAPLLLSRPDVGRWLRAGVAACIAAVTGCWLVGSNPGIA